MWLISEAHFPRSVLGQRPNGRSTGPQVSEWSECDVVDVGGRTDGDLGVLDDVKSVEYVMLHGFRV